MSEENVSSKSKKSAISNRIVVISPKLKKLSLPYHREYRQRLYSFKKSHCSHIPTEKQRFVENPSNFFRFTRRGTRVSKCSKISLLIQIKFFQSWSLTCDYQFIRSYFQCLSNLIHSRNFTEASLTVPLSRCDYHNKFIGQVTFQQGDN